MTSSPKIPRSHKRKAAASTTTGSSSSPTPTRNPVKRQKKEKELRVAVGIDFGTTLTCITYSICATSTNAKGKVVIEDLDKEAHTVRFSSDTDQQSRPFFENVCTFDGDRLLMGNDAVEHAESADSADAGSGDAEDASSLMRYLKLGICEEININRLADKDSAGLGMATMREHLARIRRASGKHGMQNSTYKLVARFIKQLWDDYARRDIIDTYSYTRADIAQAKFELVLTRPSMWTFVEDQHFIQAIEEALAGEQIANIAVFDEAHAVLAGMIDDEETRKRLQLHKTYVILDIGGGTADLASVRIHSKSPLCLKDAEVPSSGGVFGATIVVSQFRQTIEEVVKPVYERVKDAAAPGMLTWTRISQELVKRFEDKMKKYKGCSYGEKTSDVGMRISLPDVPAVTDAGMEEKGYTMQGKMLCITHAEVQHLFGDCINGIVNLVNSQISSTRANLNKRSKNNDIKDLFVVGGFSKNRYLQSCLLNRLNGVLSSDKIWFPPRFEKSAVATGAMKYAKNRNLLDSRILKASVGFSQVIEFDSTAPEHQDPPTQFDILVSAWLPNQEILTDAIRWVFDKGEAVKQDSSAEFSGTRCLLPLTGGPITLTEDVYCSPVTGVGEYTDPVTKSKFAPHKMEAARIYKVGKLEFTIDEPAKYPWFKSTKRSTDGERYAEVDYEIAVRWVGLRLLWTLTIPASGHVDCEAKNCPGQFDKTQCPGYYFESLVQEAECNLGAAFGDEQASGSFEEPAKETEPVVDLFGLTKAKKADATDTTYQSNEPASA